MYKGKRFLAIIPARSGSKGVPDKNIRNLNGKPLIAYTIKAAIDSGMMDAVVVSTDCEKYASVARDYGATVPFLRPTSIAGDFALASEYILHTIEGLKELGQTFDYFVLLQPTSPLRKPEHITDGIQMIVDEGLDSVVAFSEAEHPPSYYHPLADDLRLGSLSVKESNRQEHQQYYRINGMLYVSKCEAYQKNPTFYGSKGKALVIDNTYALDIDNEYDFALAEFMIKRYGNGI